MTDKIKPIKVIRKSAKATAQRKPRVFSLHNLIEAHDNAAAWYRRQVFFGVRKDKRVPKIVRRLRYLVRAKHATIEGAKEMV